MILRYWIELIDERGDRYLKPLESSKTPHPCDIEAVIREALDRHRAGEREYGRLNIDEDPRDFTQEATEEILDAINYLAYEIIRLRRSRTVSEALNTAYAVNHGAVIDEKQQIERSSRSNSIRLVVGRVVKKWRG